MMAAPGGYPFHRQSLALQRSARPEGPVARMWSSIQGSPQSAGPRSQQDVPPRQLLVAGLPAEAAIDIGPDGWIHKLCVEPENDAGTCCEGFFVPYSLYGRTQQRLKEIAEGGDPLDEFHYKGCNGPCWLYIVICFLRVEWLPVILQHSRVRHLYKIRGSTANDILQGYFCPQCTLMQDDREVRAREGKVVAAMVNRQPSPQAGMQYTGVVQNLGARRRPGTSGTPSLADNRPSGLENNNAPDVGQARMRQGSTGSAPAGSSNLARSTALNNYSFNQPPGSALNPIVRPRRSVTSPPATVTNAQQFAAVRSSSGNAPVFVAEVSGSRSTVVDDSGSREHGGGSSTIADQSKRKDVLVYYNPGERPQRHSISDCTRIRASSHGAADKQAYEHNLSSCYGGDTEFSESAQEHTFPERSRQDEVHHTQHDSTGARQTDLVDRELTTDREDSAFAAIIGNSIEATVGDHPPQPENLEINGGESQGRFETAGTQEIAVNANDRGDLAPAPAADVVSEHQSVLQHDLTECATVGPASSDPGYATVTDSAGDGNDHCGLATPPVDMVSENPHVTQHELTERAAVGRIGANLEQATTTEHALSECLTAESEVPPTSHILDGTATPSSFQANLDGSADKTIPSSHNQAHEALGEGLQVPPIKVPERITSASGRPSRSVEPVGIQSGQGPRGRSRRRGGKGKWKNKNENQVGRDNSRTSQLSG